MVSNESINLVNSVVQSNIEFNTKIFIFIVLFLYFIVSLYISYRLFPSGSKPMDVPISHLVTAGWLRIISVVFLFFYPLYTLVFLFQGIALELILRYVFVAYGIFGMLIGVVGLIFGFEKFLNMIGLDFYDTKGRKFRRKVRR